MGLKLVLAAAVFVAGGAGAARADLITNGSFENPSVNGGFTIFGNGGVPGWTSNNNEIEIDASGVVGLPNYARTQSVELNGNTFTVFEDAERPGNRVMAMFRCGHGGVEIRQNARFVALEGMGT